MAMKPATQFVFVTMLLDWLVVGMLGPALPQLLLNFAAGNIARASAIAGVFAFAFAFVQFFASPVMGLLSDRFGRRPVILLSSAGSAVDCLIFALAPSLWWLFVGRVLSSMTAASTGAAAAYITDVTAPEKRAAAFGIAAATFGVGFTFGPAIGGMLGSIGPRVPFFVAAGSMLVSALYGIFILPESLASEKRALRVDWSRANPLGSLRLLRRHRELYGLATSLFCSGLAVQAFSVFVLYTIYRFNWSARDNGFGLALFGAVSVVASILTGRLVARLGARRVAAGGFALGTLGFLLYMFAPNGLIFACALPLTGLWSMAGPPIQSALSQRVGDSEQGELQGAISCMRSIAMIVGPPIFAFTFTFVSAHASYPLTGTPWFFGALLLVGASMFALRYLPAQAPIASVLASAEAAP